MVREGNTFVGGPATEDVPDTGIIEDNVPDIWEDAFVIGGISIRFRRR